MTLTRVRTKIHGRFGRIKEEQVRVRFPLGHYYSALPDTRELRADSLRSRVWPEWPRETIGVDWNGEAQIDLARNVFASQRRIAFPAQPTGDPRDYYTENVMFPALDAWLLEAMLRYRRPTRLIEVGCGFSSLVTARVNREVLGGRAAVTCIDPFPPEFLTAAVEGIGELRREAIQDVPLELFEELKRDDVLFVDTSHTVKTGGDVPWIFEEVIPRLNPGVTVHIHDIFLPGEYPPEWVLDGWGWNEQYLVRAFLQFNATFEIVFGAQWMEWNARDMLIEAFPGLALPEYSARSGSSLWMRRLA